MFYSIYDDEQYELVEEIKEDDLDDDPWFATSCEGLKKLRLGPDRNASLRISIEGCSQTDFHWTYRSDLIMTDHVLKLFEKHGVTGYKPLLVEVEQDIDEKLWEVIVTGIAGAIHHDSGVVVVDECKDCGHKTHHGLKKGVGIIINEDTWDGSDIFTVDEYPKIILITERLRTIIEENGLTNITFQNLTDLGDDEEQLEYWFNFYKDRRDNPPSVDSPMPRSF